MILAVAFILLIGHWASELFIGRKYDVYYGAVARMVMLAFALAVLVLTFIFLPILNWREAEFIRQDRVMFGSGCTKIEEDAGKELKAKINQAMTKISK